jgi:hypothetical protein
MTQEESRVTPHPASRRALQVELERARAEIATQDAHLAKAGAELALEREARAVTERIASERAAAVQRLEARVRELEQVSLDFTREIGRMSARQAELEPPAEVGRRMETLHDGYAVVRYGDKYMVEDAIGCAGIGPTYVLLEALRAAGIGEEVGHG